MKWAFSSMGLVALGMCGIVIVLLFQNITINNEQDYYLLKEVTEAAMLDSIDFAYYRDTGEVKMIQEKFIENFTRRYAETVNTHSTTGYSIEFYDIIEEPPKVSILLKTGIGNYTVYGNASDYNITNQLDAIIEAEDEKIPQATKNRCNVVTQRYYSVGYGSGGAFNVTIPIRQPGDTSTGSAKIQPMINDGKDYKVESIKYIRRVLTEGDIKEHVYKYKSMYGIERDSGWSISGRISTEFIARTFNITNFKFNSNSFSWSSNYACGKTNQWETAAGTTGSICAVGILYDVTWKESGDCE